MPVYQGHCSDCRNEFIQTGMREAYCPQCHAKRVAKHAEWQASKSGVRQADPDERPQTEPHYCPPEHAVGAEQLHSETARIALGFKMMKGIPL